MFHVNIQHGVFCNMDHFAVIYIYVYRQYMGLIVGSCVLSVNFCETHFMMTHFNVEKACLKKGTFFDLENEFNEGKI